MAEEKPENMEAMAVVASGDVPGAESWRCAQAGSKSYEGNSDAMDGAVKAFGYGNFNW